jgi:hypothetical protein
MKFCVPNSYLCRSQRPRGLSRRSAAARLLRLWVGIPPGHGCECCVMSGRGLCDELITRPEESYRLWSIFLWSRYLMNEEVLAHWGLLCQKKERNVCHALFKNDSMAGLHKTAHLTRIRELFGLKICRWHAVLFCVVSWSQWCTDPGRLVARLLWRLNCVHWPVIFVGHQYGTCSMYLSLA